MGAISGDVEGCFIGTNAMSTAAAGNDYHGVLIAGPAFNVRVGGTTAAARNVISGNGLDGVAILGSGTYGNRVTGNFIRIDVTKTVALGNALGGVRVAGGSKSNVIGGTTAGGGGDHLRQRRRTASPSRIRARD